jgi:hypothetical protein
LEWGWLKNPDTREFASIACLLACDAPTSNELFYFWTIFGVVSFEGNIQYRKRSTYFPVPAVRFLPGGLFSTKSDKFLRSPRSPLCSALRPSAHP